LINIIVKRSAAISLSWGLISTLILSVVTASYFTVISATGEQKTTTGIDAVISQINTFGVGGWLQSLVPYYIAISFVIFIGCVLYGLMAHRHGSNV